MAQYPSVVVTNKGHDLISTANATNKAVTYIKAVVGDGQLNSQSIESLTAMISPKLELPLSMGVDLGDGQWRISFALSNSTLTNGFYAREVGVFAKLDGQDDSTAILFGYTNGGNYVDYIPPKTTPIDSQVFNCDFVIGDAENVTVNILDGTFVTHQALTNAIDIHNTDTSAHTDIRQKFNSYLSKVEGDTKFSTHNADAGAHTPILNAIKAITGMSAYNIAPSKTIASMIPLLGLGGIVESLHNVDLSYVKFANGFIIQKGIISETGIPSGSKVNFLIPMKDYFVTCMSPYVGSNDPIAYSVDHWTSTTYFIVQSVRVKSTTNTSVYGLWLAVGWSV